MKTKSRLTKADITPDQEIRLFREFASWSKKRKHEYIKKSPRERALRLKYTWKAWARDKQLAPEGNWSTWVIKAGRGWGKTRTGAEWVIEKAEAYPGCHIALVGRTVADVRDVMIKGRSGIIPISPPWFTPTYYPSKRLLVWPNGSYATTYSADEPDQMRGPQHSFAWADERASWQYDDAWDQLSFGLRIYPSPGVEPQCVVTTTPRNTKAMKLLVKDPTTHVTNGSMYDNQENLAKRFIRDIERRYTGTRLGRQEIEGEIIDDIDGALWKRDWIEDNRLTFEEYPELKRIVVAINPPDNGNTDIEGPAEAGIIVAGLGTDNRGYVLADYSLPGTPNEWASEALEAYKKFEADCIVGEINHGGEMVGSVVKSTAESSGMWHVPFEIVRASRGRQPLAETISNLYQKKAISHLGAFPDLEDQQCNWLQGERTPDRFGACVWALTNLMIMYGSSDAFRTEDIEQIIKKDVEQWDLQLQAG